MNAVEINELWAAIKIAKRECKNPTALFYLRAFNLACLLGPEGISTQLQYILSNMGGWRGETARSVKVILRKIVKSLA